MKMATEEVRRLREEMSNARNENLQLKVSDLSRAWGRGIVQHRRPVGVRREAACTSGQSEPCDVG